MAVYGHKKNLLYLDQFLPEVSLFLGPHSVGRWATAEHVRWRHGISNEDTLRVRTLDVAMAAVIRDFTATRPVNSPSKLVIVELYKSSQAAQLALAAFLEDVGYARVIIIAQSSEVHGVLVSRSIVYHFGYLSSEAVAEVLVHRMNFSVDRARTLAARSGGQIFQALALADAEETLDLVRCALTAIRNRDPEALEECAKSWSDEATAYLAQWCHETISRQWRVFEEGDLVEGRAIPVRILRALNYRVRPRLVVRSQLMQVLKEY